MNEVPESNVFIVCCKYPHAVKIKVKGVLKK